MARPYISRKALASGSPREDDAPYCQRMGPSNLLHKQTDVSAFRRRDGENQVRGQNAVMRLERFQKPSGSVFDQTRWQTLTLQMQKRRGSRRFLEFRLPRPARRTMRAASERLLLAPAGCAGDRRVEQVKQASTVPFAQPDHVDLT